MIDPRRQAYLPCLRALADRMGLKEWTLKIDDAGPASYDAIATARTTTGRKYLIVDLGDAFLDMSAEAKRHVLVHELLHAHSWPMNDVLEKMLNESQYDIHRVQMEFMVDGIAEEWAKSLPLPGGVKAKKRRG